MENLNQQKRTSEQTKRRREWLLVLIAFALLFLFSRYENRIFDLVADLPIDNNLFALGLININILLIILLLYLIFRNVFKLVLERRRSIPGARVRTKLVAAFVALSLIPTMLLFFVSAGFITNSIENWFNRQIETSLEESLNVAQVYYKTSGENALYYSHQIANAVKRDKLMNDANIEQLKELIRLKQQEYNLGVVEVFSSTLEELVRVSNPGIPATGFSDPSSEAILEGMTGKSLTQITPIGKADLIRGIVPVYSNWNDRDVVGVVVVNYYVPNSLVSKMREISNSFDEYMAAKEIKDKIQMSYVVVLLLIALVIIFLATWFGFYLARGITEPIHALVDATVDIAAGNLDVEIPQSSDDELGMLVSAFNRMTSDLRTSRYELQEANEGLTSSNAELDQRRKYMEVVLKNVAAGVVSVDRRGLLTTINKSAEELLGIDGPAMLGRNYRELLEEQQIPMVRTFLQELLEGGGDSIRRQVALSARGRALNLLVNVTRMRDEAGEFLGTVVVFDDLTNLIKAQRMAAWREVARRIAHEIKNPLTPIKLSAQRLRRKYLERFSDEDQVFDECTRMIVQQVDDLKEMVNEFSNFARLPASNPEPDDLNVVVQEILVLYQQAHQGISFAFIPDRQLPAVDLDRAQIKRVLINLLENAVAAMEGEEGSITLQTRQNEELRLVTLSVSDTGKGIPDEDKPRLFEPYFSTRSTGTGLGLTIVSTIVADHNGFVRVRDNHPRGSTFVIELPVSGSAARRRSDTGNEHGEPA